ncbi:Pvc16 family protein [Streptomyces sp. NPDC001070]
MDSAAGEHFTPRRRPPRWFRLPYLITAWTARTEDEHRLLSAVLSGLLPHEALPPEYLEGAVEDLA